MEGVRTVALLTKRIQRLEDPVEAWELVQSTLQQEFNHDDDVLCNKHFQAPLLAVLDLCYRHSDADTARCVLQLDGARGSEACRIAAIQTLGRCGCWTEAAQLLLPSTGLVNAWLAGYRGATESKNQSAVILDVLDRHLENTTVLSFNLALPPVCTVQHVTAVLDRMDHRCILPNQQTVAAVRHVMNESAEWEGVRERLSPVSPKLYRAPPRWTLPKVKLTGEASYWNLGTFRTESIHWQVGLQPNRNPVKNGLRMIVYQATGDKKKLAYLLLGVENQGSQATSTLLGLSIDPQQRGQGLTKHILSIWLHLCSFLPLPPVTDNIRKPLLCKVLQETFGFSCRTPGVNVGILPPDSSGSLRLRAVGGQSLNGVFSAGYCRRQNMVIAHNFSVNPVSIVTVDASMQSPNNHFQLDSFTPAVPLTTDLIRLLLLFQN